MIGALGTTVIVLALVLAGISLTDALRGRTPGTFPVGAAAVVEIAVMGQLVVAVVQLGRGERPAEFVTFLAYLVSSVLVVPLAVLWAAAERSRWAGVVLGVAGLVVAVMVLRLLQVWSGA